MRQLYTHVHRVLGLSICLTLVIGCDQSTQGQYDLTKHNYQGGNIIKNGTFDDGLLHWNVAMSGYLDYGEYIKVVNEATLQNNHVVVIHSLDETEKETWRRFLIDSIVQSFTIKPGDFQKIVIRTKVKSKGGAVPSIFVGFEDSSKHNDENANYGILDYFREISPQPVDDWHVVEFSRPIPVKADWLVFSCSGVPIDDQGDSSNHATEAFEIYCDDIEAVLTSNTN